ncbi:GNAT family N-acetyltransferase [Paenibacillus donghaensis]|uniref:GNAT family N-acetyltransferase n=1 Tax=Paenibacillus donghaensis TaxID=414771 RepID=UPI0018844AB0|nr:GNAT family N-acetyltransferase [Paenibacillus donghaensis]MBE9916036.1 GNAT family N-acetyltransferase [Paenibacillus donghaensis]
MRADTVQSIYYNQAPDALRREIAAMLNRIWPDDSLMSSGTIPATHDESLNARSFFAYVDGRLVSYAGVVRKSIKHEGHFFNIAGLSCVATHPDYQAQGLGLQTVAAATQWMEQSGADWGIFTCKPHLAGFYDRAGAWPVVPNVTLIGSRDTGALSSESLQVVVLMRLFSAKAYAYESILRHTTIDLGLPVGHFL